MDKPRRRLSLQEAGEYTYWKRLTRSVDAYTGLGPHRWDYMREETREMQRMRREWDERRKAAANG